MERLDYYKDLPFKAILKIFSNATHISFSCVSKNLKIEGEDVEKALAVAQRGFREALRFDAARTGKSIEEAELLAREYHDEMQIQLLAAIERKRRLKEEAFTPDNYRRILTQTSAPMNVPQEDMPFAQDERDRLFARYLIKNANGTAYPKDELKAPLDSLKDLVVYYEIRVPHPHKLEPFFEVEYFVPLSEPVLRALARINHINKTMAYAFSLCQDGALLFTYDETSQEYYTPETHWTPIGGLLSN